MAVLVPALDELRQLATPLNEGELKVAKALASLDDGWTIYVQPRLAQDQPDFLALHDRHGVCVIEVKDWGVRKYEQLADGRFRFRTSVDTWETSDELPRYQAHRYRTTVYDQFFALPGDNDNPTQRVRAVVVLPKWSTRDARRLMELPAVTDDELSVMVWGSDGLQASITKLARGTGCPAPDPDAMTRLRRHLAESAVVLELRSPVMLSKDASNIARNPNNARIRRVRGPAGCGKSFGLAARAATLATEGRAVLVVSYNVTLSHYLRNLVNSRCREIGANPAHVSCTNLHGLCRRAIIDAEAAGVALDEPVATDEYERIITKGSQAYALGFGERYDAVLVDEGQDFTLDWWQLLREHVRNDPSGEMLLVADPTQDIYGQRAWTDEQRMSGAGFAGTWTELKGSYRMPNDLLPVANDFAGLYLGGDSVRGEHVDDPSIAAGPTPTVRRWHNLRTGQSLGRAIGEEVVRLLDQHPALSPRDVVFLCEWHDDGLEAVEVIEAARHEVHHIFSKNDHARSRLKRRFWPDSPGVKGCTPQSFKGWETPALVMAVANGRESRRLAYVSMTRLSRQTAGGRGFLSVVNSDPGLADFRPIFERWGPPAGHQQESMAVGTAWSADAEVRRALATHAG